MPYLNSALGFSSTRTAGSELPPICTWPTPLTCESFCDRMVSAASYSWPGVRVRGGEGEDQDRRVGRIHLAVGRVAAQRGRQVGARRVDRRLDVARRAVDVAVEAELQRDVRRSGGARGGHLGHVGDLAEVPLERGGDGGGHDVGAGAGHGGIDRDGREIHLRQRCDRQLEEGDAAGERDAHGQERRGDRPADERRGDAAEAHCAPEPLGAGAAPRQPARRRSRRSKYR